MYPLDVVKTRVQLQSNVPVPGQDHYTSMMDCFRKIIKNEGASRLYRGIAAPIMMEAPKRATKFAANDSWGVFYRNLFGYEKANQPLAILTGATAGATEAFVVVPFELVKIRLQDKAQAGKYSGIMDVVAKTVKAEGPLAMYNGLESTLWRHISWNAGYFGCIFQVKSLMPTPQPGNKTQAMSTDFISGAIGGTVGTSEFTSISFCVGMRFRRGDIILRNPGLLQITTANATMLQSSTHPSTSSNHAYRTVPRSGVRFPSTTGHGLASA